MIYTSLYDWQRRIVDSACRRKAYGLFLDCGLGKTPIGLSCAEQSDCLRVIVVTINPKAEETQRDPGSWQAWCAGYQTRSDYDQGFQRKVRILGKGSSGQECLDPSPAILIVNYESLYKRKDLKMKAELRETVEDFIIGSKGQRMCLLVDESHRIKDQTSLQSMALTRIQRESSAVCLDTRSYLLTGTPFTTGYIDLWAQLKFLGCPMTKGEFKDRYCVIGRIPGLMEWQQPIVGYRNLDDLYSLVHGYALTMKSSDVVSLPERIFVEHPCPETKDMRILMTEKMTGKDIAAEDQRRVKKGLPSAGEDLIRSVSGETRKYDNPWYRDMNYPDHSWFADSAGTLWLRARQMSIGFQGNEERSFWFSRDRLNRMREFLDRNPDNYVVFYNYVPEFIELYQICSDLGYNVDVWNGEMKSMFFYDRFHSESPEKRLTDRKNVILANFASGSTGMNWQDYSKCVIFSLPLYKDWEQGLKRIHRIGQKDTVVYHVFSGDNWLDRSMRDSLDKGIQYTEDLFMKDLSKNSK
jgi:hypothetical protein